MRILAIRGQNLASLRTFEVRLDEGPLATGLFAITGPTGAGKSTLLDALCLALYDRTPRLGNRGQHVPEVGRPGAERVRANDVRGVLRRGAGAGYAEVDFEGVDGLPYRARWMVHRARKKATGKLQPQKLSFTALDDADEPAAELTEPTKGGTLAAIEAKVGLDFDQFRRSVLLAQNEFDAFLKADSRGRGQLLERMTGTALYTALSQGAHVQHREAKAGLTQVQARLSDQPVLSAERRAALAAGLADARGWLAAAERRAQAVQAWEGWAQRRDGAQAALTQADAALVQARADQADAGARRAALAEAEAVLPLRAPLQAHDDAQQALRRAAAALQAAQGRAPEVLAAARAAQDDLTLAEDALAAARAEREAVQPDLDRARRLDDRLTDAQPKAAAAQAAAQTAHARLTQAQAEHADAQSALAAAHAHLERLAAEAAEAAPWQPALAQRETVRADLATLTSASQALSALDAPWRAAQADEAQAHAAQAEAEAQRAQAEAAVLAADAAWRAAGGGDADARAAAEAQTEQARAEAHAWQRLADVARAAAALADEAQRLDAADAQAKQDRRAARAAERKAKKAQQAAQAALEAARAALRRLAAVDALAAHRDALVDGEPCPLCGSAEHPGVAVVAAEALAEQRAEVEALLERRAAAQADAAQAQALSQAADAERARVKAERQTLKARRQALLTEWAMARMGAADASLPDDPGAPGAEQALATGREAARERQAAAEARVAALRAAATDRAAQRQALDAARDRARAAQQAASAAAAEVQRAASAGAALAVRRAQHAEAQEAARARLADRLPQALQAQTDAPTELQAQVEAAFQAAAARAAQHARWTAAARDAAHAVARVADRLAARQEAAADAAAAAQAADAGVQALQAERAGVLGGQAADAVAEALQRAEHAAHAQLAQARGAHEAAQATLTQAVAAQERAEGAWHSAERAAERAADALEAELRDLGLSEADARARLADAPADPGAEATALDALDAAVHRAEAVAQQRANDHARLVQAEPALPGGLDAAAAGAQARALHAAARAQVERLGVRLAQDADARLRHAELSEAADAAERRAAVWAELDTLIGSHDGSRFRDFAQSLTLEAVIGQANHHLAELNPRYALMRVPEKDLDLQVVDRDLGDEIRAIESLSGGESFLVSLALALGLASLSARDTRIDSLFIDEGLGTLDVDTLDKVLDALDALQATGRQVGLISHVPGLAERIGARVRVQPEGAGISAVSVEGPGADWAAA